jgi:hypothetical protein
MLAARLHLSLEHLLAFCKTTNIHCVYFISKGKVVIPVPKQQSKEGKEIPSSAI